MGDWFTIRPLFFSHFQIYQQTLKKGVKIRIITQRCSDEKFIKMIKRQINPLFEVRCVINAVPIKAAIYDGKNANMCVRTVYDNEIAPSL